MIAPLILLLIVAMIASRSVVVLWLLVRVIVVEGGRLSLKRDSVMLIISESFRCRWKFTCWSCNRLRGISKKSW